MQCNKLFGHSSNLNRHIQEVHQGIKKSSCSQCGKKFSQASDLKRHVQSVHKDIRKYECTDQTDNPQLIYVFNMFIKKEEVDDENNSI